MQWCFRFRRRIEGTGKPVENQADADTASPCITSAPKSLGQVGYEAMLARMHADAKKAGQEWFPDDPVLAELIGEWENQPPKLREDWEYVATAIAKAVQP
jgi:hypothetical protein